MSTAKTEKKHLFTNKTQNPDGRRVNRPEEKGGSDMKTRYFINGWQESKSYFYDIGRFTEEEKERLESGEVLEKNGNTFHIEKEEV